MSCDWKLTYATLAEAEDACYRTPTVEKRTGFLLPYRCDEHGGFHLGHTRTGRRKRAERPGGGTVTRPKLLDLFCGAGGAAMGYHRAGFDVVGVDLNPQPHFPFEFIQADWEEPLAFLPGLWEREGIPYAIHASPPCQRYSTMTKKWGREESHPDLVEPVRMALMELNEDGAVPWVIENVPGAPLWDPVTLCGSMFGLGSQGYQLRRHRIFESPIFFFPPAMCNHQGQALPVYGNAGGSSKRDGLKFPGTDAWREGMGIDWMVGRELAESIPPAYTEYIGRELIKAVQG